jgi:queuosine precursor transporter
MRLVGLACLALYVGTIFAANWAITRYGLVTVAPGLVAPAGVYFVGIAFTLRDLTQNLLGRRWVVAAILAGAAASWVVSSSFAIASAVAFLVSETADFAVYTPLAERRWLAAVAASNVVGTVVDSIVFLALAFHSLALLRGQVVGKLWMTLVAVVLLSLARRRFPRLALETA